MGDRCKRVKFLESRGFRKDAKVTVELYRHPDGRPPEWHVHGAQARELLFLGREVFEKLLDAIIVPGDQHRKPRPN